MSNKVDQIKRLGYFEAGDSFIGKELIELHQWKDYPNLRVFEIQLDAEDWGHKIYALDLDAVKSYINSYINNKFIVSDELSFRVFEITRTKVLDFEMGYYHKI